jgi:hypothetical protein
MTQDLQDIIDKSRSTDVTALVSAKESAKRRMMEDGSPANISSFERASAALEKALEKQKPLPVEEAPAEVVPRFRNTAEVMKFLQAEGYKIKKSKLYNDVKAGFLAQSEDGSFSQNDVLAYVHTQSLDKIADNKAGKLDALSEKRLEKEVEKLTVQVEKLTWDMNRDQGKYLLKEDVRTELAMKISVFEAGFKHVVATSASDWSAAIGGEPGKYQILIDQINNAIDALLGEFAECEELDVVVEKYEV